MPADVHIDETNGGAGTTTHSISNSNYVSTDAANADAATYPITPIANSWAGSYKKYQRLHVNSLAGVTRVQNIKFWRVQGSPTSGDIHRSSATVSDWTALAYSSAAQTALMTFFVVESAEPATANVGISQSLNEKLDNIGVLSVSDYVVHQIQVSAATTAGAVMTLRWSWDEVS